MDYKKNLKEYERLIDLSINDPEKFWAPIAKELYWYKKWDKVLDDSEPPFYKWVVGGITNICYNAVDKWVKKFPDKPAYIWYSEAGKEEIISHLFI